MKATCCIALVLVTVVALSCVNGAAPSSATRPTTTATPPTSTCPRPPPAPEATSAHYLDLYGNSLEAFDPIWRSLSEFFGSTSPGRITVAYHMEPRALFDPDTDTITLMHPGGTRMVAHESAHLFISHLTNKVSITPPFRFIDEGLATVLGSQLSSSLELFRKESHNIAVEQQQQGFVSLEQLQQWQAYRNAHTPDIAYGVGASFVLHLLEHHGKAKLTMLLRSLGETQDLDRSCQAVLGASALSVFASWIEYLKTTPRFELPAEPAVQEIYPLPGAQDVPTSIKEIWVTFNRFMRPDRCAANECGNTGLCYTNARWDSHQKLVIPIAGRLLPNHRYQLSLGSAEGCMFKSARGTEMPIVPWEFTTAE